MSELAIQQGLQTLIQAMSEFENVDVVLNDYTVLDQWVGKAPYVIISNADTFVSRQDVVTPETRWEIVITLVEFFEDWETTLNSIRTRRQALIDEINSDGGRSAGGLEAVDISELRSSTPITPRFPTYVENTSEMEPVYLFQDIIAVCEEF